MKNLFYSLIIFLDTATENDINYNIALFLANNFYRIANMKINEVAKECFVSPSSISRFCRTLGYDNFAHLKQECNSFHSNDKKFNNLINIPAALMNDNPKEATKEYVSKVTSHMELLAQSLNWEEIDDVLKLIHDSDHVAFFGTQFSQSVALHFQTDLLMLEKFTMAYTDLSRQLDCAKNLTENSVVILFTVNGNYEKTGTKIFQYIKKSGCKVVLVTCNENLDLQIPVHHKILIGNYENRRTGKHNLLTAVELMSLRYYCLFYPSIEKLQEQLQ